jgi:hypothetical protein
LRQWHLLIDARGVEIAERHDFDAGDAHPTTVRPKRSIRVNVRAGRALRYLS